MEGAHAHALVAGSRGMGEGWQKFEGRRRTGTSVVHGTALRGRRTSVSVATLLLRRWLVFA